MTAHQNPAAENLPEPQCDPLADDDVFVFATSYGQQRLWFMDQFDPGSAIYNLPAALRFTGDLNVSALKQAINIVVQRQESLRTTFHVVDDQPVQVIVPTLALDLPVTDLRGMTPRERQARTRELMRAEAQTPFDLVRGPLIRTSLLSLSDKESMLLLTLHHIIADGWSMGVLVKEVQALYCACVLGEPSPLDELAIQYADYADWQREWLAGAALQQQVSYWERQLKDAPTLLALPTDRPRPARQLFQGAKASVTMPSTLASALHAVAAQYNATLFMVLSAAFNVLLARYSGNDDICVGTAVANRKRAELEPLIGFFVNTLVLRTQVDHTQSFATLLQQTRHTTLDAYAHQDVPFELLVEALKPERHLSHSPIFQVMLILQNTPKGSVGLPGLDVQHVTSDRTGAKFDLTLNFGERDGELIAAFEYSTALFDAATIERMAAHLHKLLVSIAANPTAPIASLDMIGASERQQMLGEWNNTERSYAALCPHQLIEEQARATPQRTALVCDGVQLSYAQLNARANQLAHYLRGQGVRPDSLVGVYLDRSADMLVAVLGVLKSGAAYVPLDPAYPDDRIAYMLGDARPAIVLTQATLADQLPVGEHASLCLDRDWPLLAACAETDLAPAAAGANLAYVIYTSGSTGKPKGVGVSHANLANFLHSMRETPGIAQHDVLLAVTSLSFDIAGLELYLPLCAGARLVLCDRASAADPHQLSALMVQQGVTTMQATPATWRMLLDHGWPELAQPLKVLCGGEAVTPELARAVLRHTSELWNMYGPTETTIWSAARRIEAGAERVLLGGPIANTGLYNLDAAFNPVPIGVAGELHIAGAGLARGYLHRPDLTAEKFIPHPFSTEPGARLYRTGDLVRFLADGSIDFLGRIDNQVKLRGYRIELGEIEAVLAALPAIREAVVLARAVNGEPQLVAYLVADPHDAPDDAALRLALLASLPEFMVPSHFITMAQLPQTANGKINRRALPDPDPAASRALYTAPRNDTETLLASLWQEVLKREQVGVDDNFFALGGHSLLATQLVSKVRSRLQREIPLRALFEAPTVALLAQRLAQQEPDQVQAAPIVAYAREQDMPLSFSQQRLWVIDQLQPGGASYNIPLALRLHGTLDVGALRRTLNEVVRRHEVLRTTFKLINSAPVQIVSAPCELALVVTDLAELPHGEREAHLEWLALDEARTPFDLSTGPLIRAALIHMGTDDAAVLFTVHHIVADGWSMGVLVREVAALYAAFSQGQESPLPELEIQYLDYACAQREWLAGDLQRAQLTYWTRQLAGAPTLLALPTDRPHPATPTYRGASHAFGMASSTALMQLARDAQATPFMVLNAAFSVLLARYSGQNDICVGTAIANRNRAQIEPLIGCFLNTLVLRTHVDAGVSFATLLDQMRETTLDAYANQDLPFEQLVDAMQIERNMRHSPLFQVMIVLQNAPMDALDLPGLKLEHMKVENRVAKFDLTLHVNEHEGQLRGAFEYSTDLFDAGTVERMAGHFTRLLEAICADPQARIATLDMIDAGERRQILEDWNDTARSHGALCTPQLIEQQVRAAPQRIALVCDGVQLSYAQLNAKANQLAHHLRAQGVRPDSLVGLYLERSADMLVAVLGVLKAGAAYVPLDPAYPEDRIAYMLDDARPAMVLTQAALVDQLPAGAHASLCLDRDWPQLAALADTDLAPAATGANLAYVIYTSGSTGKPKGVGVSHANLANFLHGMREAPGITQHDVLLAVTSLSFDIAGLELYLPLCAGARLVMCDRAASADPQQLSALMVQQGVTVMQATPATWRMLVEHGWPELAQPLKVLCGGEAVAPVLARALLRHAGEVWNMYGPTETTIWSAARRLDAVHARVLLSGPIANTGLYILDPAGNLVPTGVAGELHIAGAGLARGYLHRPDLTAEKFVPHPFSTEPGARLYKTGDLVRFLGDGSIDFLGRIDNQVKLRGYRIELGEIEAALGALAGVREAVVLAREDAAGEHQLVAYVVGLDAMPDVATMRSALLDTLPGYMVPLQYVVLDRMPLTPNGKVDRKALPQPELASVDVVYEAPRNDLQQALADIWTGVLKRERIGIHENFFALGGHSLMVMRMIHEIKDTFQVQLSPRLLFDRPTIAATAEMVEMLIMAEIEKMSDEDAVSMANNVGVST
jgi:amino acid adenylation domain-containing protein